jgi:hypothetical protein
MVCLLVLFTVSPTAKVFSFNEVQPIHYFFHQKCCS